jgi:hypothetical protein
MSKGAEMKVSSDTAISMPMKNLLSIVAAVAVGVWAYFGVIERLDILEMKTNTNKIQFESYREQPSRSHTDVEVMKKELEYLKKEIDQLKNSK